MKLPNRENAFISTEKLTNYLLSETHLVGKSKAKFFRKYGFNEKNVNKLERELLYIAKSRDVKTVESFPRFITAYPV